ncbi:hypothetical protein C9374_010289 [Naegleria lovaniensis]|uniref:BTB domain-containing protein n=1 Tax=Naegleria lovaniensis TaxID=51637 RepID=A0AA88KDQ7_NAELO|nr:uncharacterized protein C9374_010289 [Naegleria lovaniensis]KAG2374915.1 hypothetical protein C9374_010289 [Naegleria lovaniensis]
MSSFSFGASPSSASSVPARKSTRSKAKPKFAPTNEKDPSNHQNYDFQSITKMPSYSSTSFEQLRYEDMMEKRKKQKTNDVKSDAQLVLNLFEKKMVSGEQRFKPTGSAMIFTSTSSSAKTNYMNMDIASLFRNYEKSNRDEIESKLADCKIVFDSSLDDVFYCHKIILICRSPFFKRLFESHPKSESLSFPSISKNVMKAILQWIYCESVDPEVSNDEIFMDLVHASLIFHQKPLFRQLIDSMESEYSYKIWELPEQLENHSLNLEVTIDNQPVTISYAASYTDDIKKILVEYNMKSKKEFVHNLENDLKSGKVADCCQKMFFQSILPSIEYESITLSPIATAGLLKMAKDYSMEPSQKRKLLKVVFSNGSCFQQTKWQNFGKELVEETSDKAIDFLYECTISEVK